MAQTKIMTLGMQQYYDEKIKAFLASKDEEVLSAANEYAEGLADNYDAAGTATTKVKELADGQVKTNTDAIAIINGNDTTEGSISKAVKDAKDVIEGEIGTLEGLETTDKDNIVDAINEVRRSVSAGGTAAAISITTDTTSEGAAKSYTVYQGNEKVGTIDIPKDMVVESGSVVVNPEGQPAGTYVKLVLANATNDEIYINVGTLVDIYKAAANASQIQISVDSSTREISASIVAGSITATELAVDSVTTVKIADGNVTKAKLSTEVQATLDKADNADANAQAKADKALEDAKAYTDEAIGDVDLSGIATNASNITGLTTRMGDAEGDISAIETSLATGGATANAIAAAKKAGDDAQADVDALETVVSGLEDKVGDGFIEITTDEIDAMFA